ncbi:GNAT family N-acetyltransferase [Streptomyces subrutilus]|uniref:GNAT family N-acetyltransferase n=1 Tax=Streptomyces subrutilus TaxID=36818 RepID=UPI0033C272B0
MEIELRETLDGDLDLFWRQLTDPRVRRMAALTRQYHYDRELFDTHWAKVRGDPAVVLRTVLADGVVAGHAAVFGPPEEREVTYVIGTEHWGRGIGTGALAALIRLEGTRPLHAGAAADNAGSIRVLEKCGFTVTGRARDFSLDRGEELDVVLLTLR